MSAQFQLNSLIEVSIKTVCLSFYKNCLPGMCADDTQIFCDVHHTHSTYAMSLKNSDLIPPLLIT